MANKINIEKNIESFNEQVNNGGIRGFVKNQLKPWQDYLSAECCGTPREILEKLMDKYCPGWRKLNIVDLVPMLEAVDVILQQELGISAKTKVEVTKRRPGRPRKNQQVNIDIH